jgi:rhomboid protease GluP
MFKRQTTGSVVCASCGYLVGVNDDRCYHCGRRNPGLWGFAPALRSLGHDVGFVPFVIGTCVLVYALMLLASRGDIGQDSGPMNILSPNGDSLFLFGASGRWPVFGYGRWWTVLSAGWLHGNLIHILFNLMWIRQLAPAVGEFYGPGRMVIIYTIAGVVGFTATSLIGLLDIPIPMLRGAPLTVGASASIFGLLGALVYYGRRGGSRMVQAQAMNWAIMAGVLGFIMPGIDNWAHAGGFAGGYLAGRLLDPLTPERINHMFIAVICLALSILSIVVSVLLSVKLPQ